MKAAAMDKKQSGLPVRLTVKGGTDTMSVQVENLEKNMAKLTITVSADDFEKALH